MVKLAAEPRNIFGKKLKTAREGGKLPVVAYGHKDVATPLFVNSVDFQKVFKKAGESTVITLEVAGGDKDVLIHEVVVHPVSGEPVHADFYVIEKGKVLQVKVPLEFAGVSEAVKSLGGILVKVVHELEIEALPKDLPHGITVDISALATLESQVLVQDLKLPAGVKALAKPEDVVASITVAQEEKEETPVDLSAIEVEKKGKKDEEGAEGAEAAAAEEKK